MKATALKFNSSCDKKLSIFSVRSMIKAIISSSATTKQNVVRNFLMIYLSKIFICNRKNNGIIVDTKIMVIAQQRILLYASRSVTVIDSNVALQCHYSLRDSLGVISCFHAVKVPSKICRLAVVTSHR